jgi:hypothetical protein
MGNRSLLLVGCLVFAALGLTFGAEDFTRITRSVGQQPGLLERLTEMQKAPPTPRTVLWIQDLRGPTAAISALERPLVAAALLLLIGGLLLLGAALSPRFRLLKPPSENPASGLMTHLDIGQLLRVAAAIALTLWLVGAFSPVGSIFRGAGERPSAAAIFLSGLPAWLPQPGTGGVLLRCLMLVPFLWWLWGPRGPLFPSEGVGLGDVLATGFLAAAASLPAFLVLQEAREWVRAAGAAYSLGDPSGWSFLILLAWVLPVLACLSLPFVFRAYRPQPLSPRRVLPLATASAAALILSAVSERAVRTAFDRLDVNETSLAQRLHLPAADQSRYAYILTPEGGIAASVTEDGSSASPTDRIRIAPDHRVAAERYLAERQYRTALALRAFDFVDTCWTIDWETTNSLRVQLEMLKRAPSPVVSQRLVERLAECAITPENRRILDEIADPAHYDWPNTEGRRRLGAAYLRFGDPERAREYLLRANLTQEEARRVLGGVSPLASGAIRGRITLQGKGSRQLRLGLVHEFMWRRLAIGRNRRWIFPWQYRHVLLNAYTNDKGEFEFRHLPEGRYVLIMTGGGIGRIRGRPYAVGHPGAIELNRFVPEQTLEPIDIRFEAPTGIPQREADIGETV